MLKQLYYIVPAMLCCYLTARAQQTEPDTTSRESLDEVVVTATRTPRSIKNVPVPVTVIGQDKIERMGALRLNEVLTEQVGLQIISDHGTGIQLQGLSSDYILILIDGEPVIGRTAGTLDLTRLAIGNIQRIEIVKGPSSSLYGSEAMGGVINIITKKIPAAYTGQVRARVRRYNTIDLTAEAARQNERWGWYLFVNRLSTNGYNTTDSISKAIPAYTAWTFNPKLQIKLSSKWELTLNTRFYLEEQKNNLAVAEGNGLHLLKDRTRNTDLNIAPVLTFKPNNDNRLQVRNYITAYHTKTFIDYQPENTPYDESYFNQQFYRTEAQYDHSFSEAHTSTIGAGNIIEAVEATRYDNNNKLTQQYIFGQHQWMPSKQFNLVAGFRYDRHNQYRDRISPKLSLRWNVNRRLSIQASAGGGYKAPDFRQMLLNFTNPVAGYSVFGTSVVGAGISRLQAEGQISSLYLDPATIQNIKAESSIAFNTSVLYTPANRLTVQLNVFRNNISDLIDTRPIALKTNGQNVFSYFNYNKVFTQGIEFQSSYSLPFGLQVSAAYQYLDAKDATVWDNIKAGNVYYRDASNVDRKVKRQDYGGLYNRSKHSGNIKLLYDDTRFNYNVSLRGIYRGKFGYGGDVNSNAILDDPAEYADGYTVWNLSAQKFFNKITVEAGVNNLFKATNTYDPLLAGRQWYVGAALRFVKNTRQQTSK
ncbi:MULTISPECIES: TonB-dependent receptor plug domain-containing protein [Niastella]|uniref:TonB-dependent receptor n=1 Tax=Niastella soli TaxID=2821487 RepID=A0ABS3YMR4_9BACT|nr:TonB-dependent receptor [Niastella soli]MBO9199175.1 TonB-dependent receptor [Niastella soli]